MSRRVRVKNTDAAKLGDVASMLRTAGAEVGNLADQQTSLEIKRNVLADFCRLVGARLATGSDGDAKSKRETRAPGSGNTSAAQSNGSPIRGSSVKDDLIVSRPLPHLSPRMRQTLRLLLAGDGEKQIANKLRLSQHTIHVYVKALYRGFGVNSRGELMSHFVAAGGSIAELDDPPSLRLATG